MRDDYHISVSTGHEDYRKFVEFEELLPHTKLMCLLSSQRREDKKLQIFEAIYITNQVDSKKKKKIQTQLIIVF